MSFWFIEWWFCLCLPWNIILSVDVFCFTILWFHSFSTCIVSSLLPLSEEFNVCLNWYRTIIKLDFWVFSLNVVAFDACFRLRAANISWSKVGLGHAAQLVSYLLAVLLYDDTTSISVLVEARRICTQWSYLNCGVFKHSF